MYQGAVIAARKSGSTSAVSAETMPTSVTHRAAHHPGATARVAAEPADPIGGLAQPPAQVLDLADRMRDRAAAVRRWLPPAMPRLAALLRAMSGHG